LAWLFIVIKVTRSPDYAMVNWTMGVVLAWGLTMTLWLPALNAGSSYRAAFLSLKKSMPVAYSCLASEGLGESERAMLEYFTGLQTRRIETLSLGNSDLLLEQRCGSAQASTVSPAWQKIWEFRRPNIHPKEIFTLYRKRTGT
jgi:4-amino-4-deoxy-L-arabinose transferase-like glycosyltransferase